MTITVHRDLIQGSDPWLAARCGLLTASEMKLIITAEKLAPAKNDKQRAHLYEMTAQRISGFVEPHYISDDMMRGMEDEIEARIKYEEHYAPVDSEIGFITNDKWGVTIGYSPDGMVGDDGLIECKSRRQKYQIETILSGEVPSEHIIQVQTGLLVSERSWCDYISYSAGLPMATIRVYPDQKIQDAIVRAAAIFEKQVSDNVKLYHENLALPGARLIPTERRKPEGEITV